MEASLRTVPCSVRSYWGWYTKTSQHPPVLSQRTVRSRSWFDDRHHWRNHRPQGSWPRSPSGKQKATITPAAQKTPSLKPCTRCGKGTHPHKKCPARDAICHRCQRKGHYGALCYSKQASLSETTSLDTAFLDTAFMDTMTYGAPENAWLARIRVDNKEILFKLDTGGRLQPFPRKLINTLGSHHFKHLKSYFVVPPDNPYKYWGSSWDNSLTKLKFPNSKCLWSRNSRPTCWDYQQSQHLTWQPEWTQGAARPTFTKDSQKSLKDWGTWEKSLKSDSNPMQHLMHSSLFDTYHYHYNRKLNRN